MSPEAWAAILAGAGTVLGVGLRWLYSILRVRWEQSAAGQAAAQRVAVAERKERRAEIEDIVRHWEKASATKDEDIAELRDEIAKIREEHQHCREQTAEMRIEIVGLKRDLRRIYDFLREKKIDYPIPHDNSSSNPDVQVEDARRTGG